MRTRLPVLVLLSLAGCAARVPAPAPPDHVPQAPLARAAWGEWDAWGRVTIDGWTLSRPPGTGATPARFDRLIGYWQVVPGGAQVARRHERLRSAMRGEAAPPSAPEDSATQDQRSAEAGWEDIGLYAQPAWSAAFVSAMARQVGIPNQALPSSARHASYIDAVLARWRRDPDGAAFVPQAPEAYAPREGDLVCADRSAFPLEHWTLRLASPGRPRAMHCDVVVRTAPGVVDLIGGNVRDTVALRRLPADAEGRVLAAPPGFPAFVVILAARDGPNTQGGTRLGE